MARKVRYISAKDINSASELIGKDLSSYYVRKDGRVKIRMSDNEYQRYISIKGGKLTPKTTSEKLVEQLIGRYSTEELKALAKGEGLGGKAKFKKITFDGGVHVKVGVISDTHIGSKYTNDNALIETLKMFERRGCQSILHLGDVVDGNSGGRHEGEVFEQSEFGYESQKERSVDVFSRTGLPIYAISGNHDLWYRQKMGAYIVRDISRECENFHHIGDNKYTISISGVNVMLFHGNDGSPMTKSYRQQNIANNILAQELDENKPQILLLGHVHKYCVTPQSGIMTISAPSFQCLSGWMEGTRKTADVGAMILEFDAIEGEAQNISTTYIKMPTLTN